MLKKISILLLVILMTISLSACGSKDKKEKFSGEELGNIGEIKDNTEEVEDEMILVSKNEVEQVNIQAKEQANKIKSLNKDLDKKEEEITFYKNYVKRVLKSFTPEQLQSVIDLEWEYSLSINNVDFPKNGILEIKENNFSLIINEKRVDHSVLSQADSDSGKYPGSLVGILSIPSTYKHESEAKDISEINSLVKYKFSDLNSDDIIEIRINPLFRDMMGYETDILKIIIK